jgi:predicted amidohydrolase
MMHSNRMRLGIGLTLACAAFANNVSLTVAGLRIVPERWNKEANLAKFERFARAAAAQGEQLAIAPEGFLEGYVGNAKTNPGLTREKYFSIGENIDGPALMRVRSLARELKMYLGLGFAERLADHMYNSVAVFSPEGEVALHYSKAHNDDDEPFQYARRRVQRSLDTTWKMGRTHLLRSPVA